MSKKLDSISLAAISLSAHDDPEDNLRRALLLCEEAVSCGAKWLQLPEMFIYSGDKENLRQVASLSEEKYLPALAAFARRHNIVLFAGSVPALPLHNGKPSDAHKVLNTAWVINQNGDFVARYDKIHLFQLESSEFVGHKEEDFFISGTSPCVFELGGWNIALGICFDLRFSQFFHQLSIKSPLDMIALPSAFTEETGKDHWHVLNRFRAMEQQCYLWSANQSGKYKNVRHSYGHSLIVDPWGTVLADSGPREGIALAYCYKGRVAETRQKLPLRLNVKSELYSSWF